MPSIYKKQGLDIGQPTYIVAIVPFTYHSGCKPQWTPVTRDADFRSQRLSHGAYSLEYTAAKNQRPSGEYHRFGGMVNTQPSSKASNALLTIPLSVIIRTSIYRNGGTLQRMTMSRWNLFLHKYGAE
jgi:hypothetical protein